MGSRSIGLRIIKEGLCWVVVMGLVGRERYVLYVCTVQYRK